MSEIKKILGNRIQELRKQKDITQEVLAEKAGFDQRTMSLYENGRSMSINTLESIIEALGIDIPEFFRLKEPIEKTDTEIIKEITDILPTLSSKELRLCYRVLCDIKEEL